MRSYRSASGGSLFNHARHADDIGATPPSADALLLLLLPLLLKLQKFVVFAADGSAVQYHIRAAVQRITENIIVSLVYGFSLPFPFPDATPFSLDEGIRRNP